MTRQEILKWRQEASGMNKLLGIQIIELDEGCATASLNLVPEVLNPLGMAHGGTIFTLCDVAAGTAAASRGRVAVTLSSSIDYYKPGKAGETLIARATERKHGRTTNVYHVEVQDTQGTHVADARFIMFYTGAMIEDLR